jgi:predicted phage-related endonuclease
VNAIRVDRAKVEPLLVGASELGAVLGCDPFTTPLQLYRRKRGLDPAPATDDAMTIGTVLEGPVVQLARAKLPETIRRNRLTWAHPTLELFATPDAFVGRDRVLEVKVVGLYGARGWDDGPPCHVQLQVQGQLLVTGRDAGYVAMLSGTELKLWTLPADPVVQSTIADAVRAFVVEHLDPGVPPDPLTYGERWADVLEQLRGLDRVEAVASGAADAGGRRLLDIRDEAARLDDEAKDIRLELARAMLAAGATRLVGNGWTGTVQDTKSGATIVVRAWKDRT